MQSVTAQIQPGGRMGELESAASLSVGTVESDIVRCYGAGPAGFFPPTGRVARVSFLEHAATITTIRRMSTARPIFLWAVVDFAMNLFTA